MGGALPPPPTVPRSRAAGTAYAVFFFFCKVRSDFRPFRSVGAVASDHSKQAFFLILVFKEISPAKFTATTSVYLGSKPSAATKSIKSLSPIVFLRFWGFSAAITRYCNYKSCILRIVFTVPYRIDFYLSARFLADKTLLF